MSPSDASALRLLSALLPPPPPGGPGHIMDRREPRARWCPRCGAPRNLGRRDCPGCRLLADGRRRLTGYIARHGVPEGGPVELARRADVPLRVVGELIAEGARSREAGVVR